jgi:pimeloyl-ACP methyl ester carboxylesterase
MALRQATAMLAINDGGVDAVFEAMCRDIDETISVFRSSTPQADVPGYRFGYSAGTIVISIGGVSTALQGRDLAQGYAFETGEGLSYGINSYTWQSATKIFAAVSPYRFVNAPRVVIIGHSWGGANAQTLSLMLNAAWPQAIIQVTTFGQPKGAWGLVNHKWDFVDYARWVVGTDPVCFMPPSVSQQRLMYLAFDGSERVRLNSYQQVRQGYCLVGNGQVALLDNPPLPGAIADLSLAGWATGWDGVLSESHGIPAYMRMLGEIPGIFSPSPPPSEQAAIPLRVRRSETPAEIQQYCDEQLSEVSRAADQNPVSSVKIPDQFTWKAVRVSATKWGCEWQGQVVVIAPGRSRAKRMARHATSLLRGMQQAGMVDSSAVANAMIAYFNSGGTPGQGFSPVAKVVNSDVDPFEGGFQE